MVTVFPIDQVFSINIYADEKKTKKGLVQIMVQPLRHKQKVLINSAAVSLDKGETFYNKGLSNFLTLKNSIKKVTGLKGVDGKEFVLEFEKIEDYEVLTDECLESLINCELGYVLEFYAVDAIAGTPHHIINPMTHKRLQNVEFKPWVDPKKK